MAIIGSFTSYNGTPLTYARVTDIEMDFQTRQSKVTLSGYPDRRARQLGYPAEAVLHAEFEMPDPVPEDMVAFVYARLADAHPEVDFAEV